MRVTPAVEATPSTASWPLHLQGSPGLVTERQVLGTSVPQGPQSFALYAYNVH